MTAAFALLGIGLAFFGLAQFFAQLYVGGLLALALAAVSLGAAFGPHRLRSTTPLLLIAGLIALSVGALVSGSPQFVWMWGFAFSAAALLLAARREGRRRDAEHRPNVHPYERTRAFLRKRVS